jgi:photosystem II stability/assembly factor-like uncharacterized protein
MVGRWITTGNAYGLQDSSVYIKQYGTLDAFVWGGRCWRLDDSSETLGGMTITTRFNPRGGVERDQARDEAPGESSGTLVMKRLQADRAKTDLRRCKYVLDQRFQCGGLDRDSPYAWEEITRQCYVKFNERSLTGSNWEGDEDAMVTLPWVALNTDDIYRVGGAEIVTGVGGGDLILDIDSCQPSRCPDRCDDQEDCIVIAVTEDDVANSYALVNLAGGDDDNWTSVTLTAFGANDANAVKCLGSFFVAISTADTSIIYSDDLGTTQVNIDQATYSDWTTNPPACLDALDQTFIVMGGNNGYVYSSEDAARTWTTRSSGEATSSNLTNIMIARDNPMVIYATSNAADVVVKSENGGRTWFAVTATGTAGTGPTALWVVNQSIVLVGTDAGEIFQTLDGGTTWTEQVDLPGATVKANVTINDFDGCGCDVIYMVARESGGAGDRIYRNVDGGAQGRWYEPSDIDTPTAGAGPVDAITCCGPNHAVGVGGATGASEAAILIN